jgi:methyl-accepting chemotaxis protein
LIAQQVQEGTQHAVAAMQRGSEEVADGSRKADQGRRSRGEILHAVNSTVRQVTAVADSAPLRQAA